MVFFVKIKNQQKQQNWNIKVIQPGDVIYNGSKGGSLPCWYWGEVKEKCEKTKSMQVKTGLKQILLISAKSKFALR